MFTTIRNYLSTLESELFYRYVLVALGICGALTGGLIYWHYRTVQNLYEQAESINLVREHVKGLLTQDDRVNKQRRQVNTLLKKEPEFKIRGYFDNLVNKFGLQGAIKTPPETSSVEQEGEHTEVILTTHLSGISMEQLTNLLKDIEDYERVYPKSIDIIKSKTQPSIDVNLVIATLLLRTE